MEPSLGVENHSRVLVWLGQVPRVKKAMKPRARHQVLRPDLAHPQNSQQGLMPRLESPFASTSLSSLPAWINQGPQPAGNSLTDHPFTLSQILSDPSSCKPSLSPLAFQA